jgi:uncharacterized membrane protein
LAQPSLGAVSPKHGFDHHKTSLPASQFHSMSPMNLDAVQQLNHYQLTIIAALLSTDDMPFRF